MTNKESFIKYIASKLEGRESITIRLAGDHPKYGEVYREYDLNKHWTELMQEAFTLEEIMMAASISPVQINFA